MDKTLNFLTKPLVDEAVAVIDSNGIPSKREGKGYAVAIGEKHYPFKLLVTEAAKIAGVTLNSKDFSSNDANRNGFQNLTGFPIINLGGGMEYFDLKQIEEYKNEVGKQYKSNSSGAKCYNDTRSKLQYLGKQLGELFGVDLVNNYNEKPNKMAGQGKGFVQKEYILTGFLPKKYHENGDLIFIKLVFAGFSSKIRLGIDIDVNFSDENNPYNQNRDALQKESHWEIIVDENFPTNWEDLIDVLTPVFEKQLKIIDTFFSQKAKTMDLINQVNILKYKKQIILQGPPGTGKTREAKLIAKSLLGIDEILGIDFFRNALPTLKKVQATNNNNPIFIDFIKDDIIHFKETRSFHKFSFSLKDLYDCYLSKDYKNDDFVQYPQYSKRCLVMDILRTYKKSVMQEQCKLIQFHPSYTYEDFVRGIVAKPNSDGDGVVYDAENKTLGAFAAQAYKNYKESKVTVAQLSKDNTFDAFVAEIISKIDENEKYMISDKVYIYFADNTRFKYKGDNWTAHPNGLNMNFAELKKIINLGLETRQEINKNDGLNSLTRQHATYYQNVIELYKSFANQQSSEPVADVKEKNYVLIIDEINRANLSSVLGELIYALEYRGEAVQSMYAVEDDNKLILPPNLYIIGTMNTADRSVGHIDYAIRRRFAFVDVLPKDLSGEEKVVFDTVLFNQVVQLFDTNLSPEFKKKEVQLGHSYFIDKSTEIDGAPMAIRLEYEIKPILEEYVKDGVLIGEDIKTKIEKLEASI